jgi:competence ComEA-like helix-hairpin-helix protein
MEEGRAITRTSHRFAAHPGDRSGFAAFVLSAALFALALPGPSPVNRPCANPVESEARDGHTTAVACTADPGEGIRGPARRLFGLPIDLNCARVETLETFEGIGPVRAQSIVEARNLRPFERVDDLTRVHGIGPKTLARMRGGLMVAPAAARSAGAGSLDSPACRSRDRRAARDREEERL